MSKLVTELRPMGTPGWSKMHAMPWSMGDVDQHKILMVETWYKSRDNVCI